MYVECLGAAGRVTGSCHLVEAGGFRILLDCGLIQGRRSEAALNEDPFPFDLSQIDAVVLSHAHIDHSGRIPLLAKRGYSGPVYAHEATQALCDVMLRDSASIHEMEATRGNKRREKGGQNAEDDPIEPLYTIADAETAMTLFRGQSYHKKFDVTPSIRARFKDAGHILGSCIVELWLTEGVDTRKLVFSGDLGQAEVPVLRNPDFISSADLVLMESTYGDRNHRSWQATLDEVREVAEITRNARGNILIPAFAVGRSQLLLYWMTRYFEEAGLADWNIYLDSPLAIRATQVYQQYMNLLDQEAQDLWRGREIQSALPNLSFTLSADESRELNELKSGAIFIAGSGMCTGGRIRHHLERNISRPECHIIIVGYQAVGTPGRLLVEGTKKLRLFGKEHDVLAQVHTIGGLSAHAGQSALVKWYDQIQERPAVVLVHGEPEAQAVLQEKLINELAAPVHIARPGDRFDLRKPVPF